MCRRALVLGRGHDSYIRLRVCSWNSIDTAVGNDCHDAICILYCFKFSYQLNNDLYEAMGNTNITTSTNKKSSLASSSAYPS